MSMYSKIVFAIPLISLIYFFQTLFFKTLRKLIRIPLAVLAGVILLYDVLISLYFYTSCFEMAVNFGVDTCLSWIYPTLDFKLMVIASVLMLTISVWALVDGWSRKAFYFMGALVLYMGLVFRSLVLFQSMRVAAISGSVNSAVLFEFFTIIVVYGLVSAVIYLGVAMLGLFRRFSYLRE